MSRDGENASIATGDERKAQERAGRGGRGGEREREREAGGKERREMVAIISLALRKRRENGKHVQEAIHKEREGEGERGRKRKTIETSGKQSPEYSTAACETRHRNYFNLSIAVRKYSDAENCCH